MRAGQLLLIVLPALFAPAYEAAAQQPDGVTIRGRILGPDNAALPDQPVVLHRVQASQGATISESVTNVDGEFELNIPAQTDTTAVYFVATRHEGELYIGAPFRSRDENAQRQIIQVGVPGTSATAILGGTGAPLGGTGAPQSVGRPLTSRNWLLLIIPLIGVAAVAIYALVPRSRVPPDRALLIRIAELDERMSTAPGGQRESLHHERSRLAAQLRGG
ncbi:MAG: hypothetical protein ACREK1_01620 [Longimicrobiales bacterium]